MDVGFGELQEVTTLLAAAIKRVADLIAERRAVTPGANAAESRIERHEKCGCQHRRGSPHERQRNGRVAAARASMRPYGFIRRNQAPGSKADMRRHRRVRG